MCCETSIKTVDIMTVKIFFHYNKQTVSLARKNIEHKKKKETSNTSLSVKGHKG